MRHLALSISFEREVSANFSPILLFDFATVFVYVYGTRDMQTVTLRSPVSAKSLIDIFDLLPRIGFSAGFSTADAWACGIDESQWSIKADVRFPHISSPPIHQGGH